MKCLCNLIDPRGHVQILRQAIQYIHWQKRTIIGRSGPLSLHEFPREPHPGSDPSQKRSLFVTRYAQPGDRSSHFHFYPPRQASLNKTLPTIHFLYLFPISSPNPILLSRIRTRLPRRRRISLQRHTHTPILVPRRLTIRKPQTPLILRARRTRLGTGLIESQIARRTINRKVVERSVLGNSIAGAVDVGEARDAHTHAGSVDPDLLRGVAVFEEVEGCVGVEDEGGEVLAGVFGAGWGLGAADAGDGG